MPQPTRVLVRADDPLSTAGIASQLRSHHDLEILPPDTSVQPDIVVLAAERVEAVAADRIRRVCREGTARVVLVVDDVSGADLLAAVEAGVSAIVRRSEATSDRLVTAVRAAATGDGHLPPDLLGRLLRQVGQGQGQHGRPAPTGLTVDGVTSRELTVLRLIADGYSTGEIAIRLAYSERTIKNAVHDLVSRFQLKNRSHAVAYAVRQGLI